MVVLVVCPLIVWFMHVFVDKGYQGLGDVFSDLWHAALILKSADTWIIIFVLTINSLIYALVLKYILFRGSGRLSQVIINILKVPFVFHSNSRGYIPPESVRDGLLLFASTIIYGYTGLGIYVVFINLIE